MIPLQSTTQRQDDRVKSMDGNPGENKQPLMAPDLQPSLPPCTPRTREEPTDLSQPLYFRALGPPQLPIYENRAHSRSGNEELMILKVVYIILRPWTIPAKEEPPWLTNCSTTVEVEVLPF